ncbi:PorP/SprF family type IX secretion system membrane protein [Cognatitamlana onchidii]|uniref:PorP/SprF family type IX secretion system membrane protein n=1 Tax=Cognatitamlana onchidii TaxID=2562860 RepID=UPI001F3E030A|nr:type IX secretion system membrane protein PorP/SprF [Algibacter onchidii]
MKPLLKEMKQLSAYYKTLVLFTILLGSSLSVAQQDPQVTQYMYNMSVINPAYATAELDVLNLGGMYRSQWVGMEGAPRTASFFAHKPLNDKIEMGISFTNDNIGDVVNESNIFADFAYVIRVGFESKLSFGAKAGVSFYNANFDGFVLQSGDRTTDVAFNNNVGQTFPNLGFGAFFFRKNFYLGISAPNVLSRKHIETENGIAATGVENVHYFLTGGYVFDLSDNVKFKPAFMAKAVTGAPLSLDITANVLFKERIEAGLAYRLEDAVSALVNFRVSPEIRIGYAYDYSLTNLSDFNSGSHEIILLWDIDLFKTSSVPGYDRSPRFF